MESRFDWFIRGFGVGCLVLALGVLVYVWEVRKSATLDRIEAAVTASPATDTGEVVEAQP